MSRTSKLEKRLKAVTGPVAHEQTFEHKWVIPKAGEIVTASIGGVGEIGMNMTLYGTNERYVVVDAGVGFVHQDVKEKTGIGSRTIDMQTLEEIYPNLDALVITHAHEDHIGGVVEFLKSISLPVYATPLAAAILETKIKDSKLDYEPEIIRFNPGDEFKIGELDFKTGSMSHSVPESCCLFISTEGVEKGILHTGDYNMDESPATGYIDRNFLKRLGDNNMVGAVVGDSTNVLKHGRFSEKDVAGGIENVMQTEKGGLFIACFASNVGRIATIADAARRSGRQVAIAGRSMRNFVKVGRELGYLDGIPEFLEPEELDNLPQNERVLIMTGTQGEPNAALARMLKNVGGKTDMRFPNVQYGDTILISGRTIPGNEKMVRDILDGYRNLGVNTIDGRDTSAGKPLHISGHASYDDIEELYTLTNPDVVIPVHGEAVHLIAHAELAQKMGKDYLIPTPGAILSLDNQGLHHIGHITPVIQEHMAHDGPRQKKKMTRSAPSNDGPGSF